MQNSHEIKNALDNINYYNKRIKELTLDQFSKDMALPEMNNDVGSLRFRALEAIASCSGCIEVYTENITVNLKTADSQDKELVS